MSGRRHALVIGIDTYPGFGLESQLAGAVRDARKMVEMLIERHGFTSGDVLQRIEAQATRSGILDALETLRRRVGSGDQVLVFFSGHGSQMTDREGDEGDGLDETLVPFDGGRGDAENRDITDDEINHWAAGILEVTPHLTLIFDCCHAATLHRPAWRVRSVPPDLRPVDALPSSPVPTWRDVETGPRPLMLAACRDDERAFELPPSIAGEDRGAFSLHLVEALRNAAPGETWGEIFTRSASALAADCPEQHPQVSGDGLNAPIFGGDRSDRRKIDVGQGLLKLAAKPNRFRLSMQIFRSRGGAWRRVGDGSFVEGDRLRVDLRHGHDRELFVYLLDVGLTGAVTLLFPDIDGHEVLDPGTVLTVGARRGDALELFLPGDMPLDRLGGTGHLLMVAAEARLSMARLPAAATDTRAVTDDATRAVVRAYRIRRA